MKVIFKEPLFIFLLLGGAMFVLFQQVSNDALPDNAEIVVTKGQIEVLEVRFEKVWQRPPGAMELNTLVESYIREEVLYREALALGLDINDGVVRRRLSQKMQFLFEDFADLEQADDITLQLFLDKHVDQYTQPSRFSFRQIYFNTSKRGEATQGEAASLLVKLKQSEVDGRFSGDPIMINHQFDSMRETEVERILGAHFVQALGEIPVGSWQGPIESGFGLHLVFIDKFVASKVPKLDDVRARVVRDWTAEKRTETNRAIYEKVRQRYHVVVEEYAGKNSAEKSTARLSMNAASQ
jgi:hypothetical protein